MRQRDRFAVTRQQHEEPAGPHAVDAQDARRGGVDAAKVVQQPAVGTKLAQDLFERGEIEPLERFQ